MNTHLFKTVIVSLLLLLAVIGSASAVTITGLTNESTSDTTPTISFTVTGNNSSYVAILYIDSDAVGSVVAVNATSASITANTTQTTGDHTYYVTAYNATEDPTLTTSSTYALEITTFASIVSMLVSTVGMFGAILDIVIGVIPIVIALGIATFVLGMFTVIFAKIKEKI